MTVTVPHDQGPKEPLFTVEAVDNDKTFSCQGNAVTIQHCPCAKMLYQIEFGNDDSTFTINSETGDVFLSRGAKLNPYQEYFVTIVVRNPTVTGINYTDLPTQETSFRSRMNVIMYVRKFGYESSDVAEAIPVKLDEGEWQGYPAEFSRNLMDEEGDVLHSRLKRVSNSNLRYNWFQILVLSESRQVMRAQYMVYMQIPFVMFYMYVISGSFNFSPIYAICFQ